jgi:vacuolar-type H+-ATPase subunit I/STV1
LVLQDKFSKENVNLKTLLDQAKQQINDIEKIKQDYENEIKKLNQNNVTMIDEIKKQNDIIIESKKLINSLAQFGDKYTNFANTIDTDLIKMDTTENNLENTSNILKNLVNKLENETFEELDINKDGMISKEEFEIGLEKLVKE